ncbi:MAG: site-2 protease family protein [Sumerlaeia bacterium]
MIDDATIGQFLIYYPIFLFSLTLHEYGHAVTAKWAGDLTAAYENRVNLNPLNHIEFVGTILIPCLMFLGAGGFMFGWARPVPVNENQFKDKNWNVVVTLAGPFMNFLIMIFAGFALGLFSAVYYYGIPLEWWAYNESFYTLFIDFCRQVIFLNALLILFNLLPIPPLDGSHIFYHFFIRGRGQYYQAWDNYTRFGLIVLLIAIQVLPIGQIIMPITYFWLKLTQPFLFLG